MISNIPIFRAKKIDSDEYVEGSLIKSRFIFKDWIDDVWTSFGETRSNKAEVYTIDPTTLSISFPDMLDSQGNKIFASLQKDGKGGDLCEYTNIDGKTKGAFRVSQHFTYGIHLKLEDNTYVNIDFKDKYDILNFEIIGIQE